MKGGTGGIGGDGNDGGTIGGGEKGGMGGSGGDGNKGGIIGGGGKGGVGGSGGDGNKGGTIGGGGDGKSPLAKSSPKAVLGPFMSCGESERNAATTTTRDTRFTKEPQQAGRGRPWHRGSEGQVYRITPTHR